MPTRRSYGDACGIARALDAVGERWALLVVRELLLGPRRFSDLRRALPTASSNLVTDRLRELVDHGVITRRKLAPPAGSWVYELTERGRQLKSIVLALGEWGARLPLPPAPITLSATSVLLALQTFAHPDPDAPTTTWCLELDDQGWTIRVAAGRLHLEAGAPTSADISFHTDAKTLSGLLAAPEGLDAAVSAGDVVVSGDRSAVRRLLEAVTFPTPIPAPA